MIHKMASLFRFHKKRQWVSTKQASGSSFPIISGHPVQPDGSQTELKKIPAKTLSMRCKQSRKITDIFCKTSVFMFKGLQRKHAGLMKKFAATKTKEKKNPTFYCTHNNKVLNFMMFLLT